MKQYIHLFLIMEIYYLYQAVIIFMIVVLFVCLSICQFANRILQLLKYYWLNLPEKLEDGSWAKFEVGLDHHLDTKKNNMEFFLIYMLIYALAEA